MKVPLKNESAADSSKGRRQNSRGQGPPEAGVAVAVLNAAEDRYDEDLK